MTTPDTAQTRPGSIRDVMLAVVIVAASVGGLWWWSLPARATHVDVWLKAMDVPVTLDPRLQLGRSDAQAVVVVVSDFQCPFCATFALKTLPHIKSEFVDNGKLAVYFRHYIGRTHRLAAPAAAVAECAGTTGNFWRVHDQFFGAVPYLTEDLINRQKDSLSSPTGGRVPCPESPAAVKDDTRWALQLGATGTPYFFLGEREGGSKVVLKYAFGGARPLSDFRKVVARLLDD